MAMSLRSSENTEFLAVGLGVVEIMLSCRHRPTQRRERSEELLIAALSQLLGQSCYAVAADLGA